jgi:dTDP-4-amino-4,6-dideoxygalactose transaminase
MKDAIARLGYFRGIALAFNTRLLLRHFKWPIYGLREAWALLRVLGSRRWGHSSLPRGYVREFEKAFSTYHSAKHGICTTSGSTALAVAYRAAGLRWGDEVIVPALTFSTTATVALEQGIVPVFADVDQNTMCIDPIAVRNALTCRTRAVVAVHLGAEMADVGALHELCADEGLQLIEDCAHAHGAKWRGGSPGRLRCYSFQSSKLIACGEGGIILTDDDELASRCRLYVDCGRVSRTTGVPNTRLGSNHRMTEFQGAVLLAQLSRFPAHMKKRQANIALLDELLSRLEGVEVLKISEDVMIRPAYGYYFRYLGERLYRVPLWQFVNDLWSNGIVAWDSMYLPVYQSPEFGWRDSPVDVDYAAVSCPTAEIAALRELVWIPHMAFLAGPRHTRHMGRAIRSILEQYKAMRG